MGHAATLFVSHGSPMLAVTHTPAHEFLDSLGAALPRPRAILCISAHWESGQPTASSAARPETIHDFYGFPDELYRLQYLAPGAPDVAREAVALLQAADIAALTDERRGLDHGAWVPLMLMYPQADIPVVQLSIQQPRGPAWHFRLGKALAPLAADDVMIMASGSSVHNLRDLDMAGNGRIASWAREFDDWIDRHIVAGDAEALLEYRARAPHAVRAHPRDEHLLPLFVALGAADGRAGKPLHRSFELGSLGMSAWGWD